MVHFSHFLRPEYLAVFWKTRPKNGLVHFFFRNEEGGPEQDARIIVGPDHDLERIPLVKNPDHLEQPRPPLASASSSTGSGQHIVYYGSSSTTATDSR